MERLFQQIRKALGKERLTVGASFNLLGLSLVAVAVSLSAGCGKKRYEANSVLIGRAIRKAADEGKWAEARTLAEKAVSQNPDDANAHVMLALALEQAGELKKAIEEAAAAVETDPDNFMAQYTYGRLLFKASDYAHCPKPLKKARKLKPNEPCSALLLARTNVMLGVDKEAIKNYLGLASMKDYAKNPAPYNELGVLFFKRRDYPMAKRCFERALTCAPSDRVVNLNLAVFWDKIASICAKDKVKARIAKAKALKYYQACLDNLSESNPGNDAKRRRILARMKVLGR